MAEAAPTAAPVRKGTSGNLDGATSAGANCPFPFSACDEASRNSRARKENSNDNVSFFIAPNLSNWERPGDLCN